MGMSLSKLQEIVKDIWEAWRAAVHGVTKIQKQLSDWTTTILKSLLPPSPQGSREQEATAERKPDAEHELQGAGQDQHPGSYLYL